MCRTKRVRALRFGFTTHSEPMTLSFLRIQRVHLAPSNPSSSTLVATRSSLFSHVRVPFATHE